MLADCAPPSNQGPACLFSLVQLCLDSIDEVLGKEVGLHLLLLLRLQWEPQFTLNSWQVPSKAQNTTNWRHTLSSHCPLNCVKWTAK